MADERARSPGRAAEALSEEEALSPRWLRFLGRHGAGGRGHSESTLLRHLVGTRGLLVAWGARPAVCRAGLFHSVYGTESFRDAVVPWSRRAAVRAEIGPEAEQLAYWFGAMRSSSLEGALAGPEGALLDDRFTGGSVVLGAAAWRDLFELSAANTLEQLPRVPPSLRAPMLASARRLLIYLSPAAARAVEEATRR